MTPYYADESVTLYHGDMLPVCWELPGPADLVIADPPYGETSLAWDRWPHEWPRHLPSYVDSLWCFGSLRTLAEHWREFTGAGWRFSHDVVWEKHNGSGFATDRFKRVHEVAAHWYRAPWKDIRHEVPRVPGEARPTAAIRGRQKPTHTGDIGSAGYEYGDDRQARSVLRVPSAHGYAIHPTQKPVGILIPLIEYGCPLGGTVLDPFAGSGSTAEAARMTGRKAILVEADEKYCELIARRMSQGVLADPPPGLPVDAGVIASAAGCDTRYGETV